MFKVDVHNTVSKSYETLSIYRCSSLARCLEHSRSKNKTNDDLDLNSLTHSASLSQGKMRKATDCNPQIRRRKRSLSNLEGKEIRQTNRRPNPRSGPPLNPCRGPRRGPPLNPCRESTRPRHGTLWAARVLRCYRACTATHTMQRED